MIGQGNWFADNWVAILAAIISGLAALASMAAARRSVAAQKRLLEIEEQRELHRIAETRKAVLVADLIRRDGTGPSWRLEIQNTGKSDARDVTVLLDGQPITDHPAVVCATSQGLNEELVKLSAGARFRYVMVPLRGCAPPWELQVTWADDSGEPGSYCMTLTF